MTRGDRNSVARFWRDLPATAVFAYYELRKQYADYALGLFWLPVVPLVQMSAYVLVFAVLFQPRLGGAGWSTPLDYAVFVQAGLVAWQFISFSFSRGLEMVNSYSPVIRQPKFPYRILPTVVFLISLPGHLTGLMVLIVLLAVTGRLSGLDPAMLVPFYLIAFFFVRGAATLLGAAAARLPDLRSGVPLLLQLLLYGSPVVYSPAMLPEALRPLMLANPLAYFVSTFRVAMTSDTTLSVIEPRVDMAILGGLAAVLWLSQTIVLKRIRNGAFDGAL